MRIRCVVALPGRAPTKGELSDEHAMSSYGLPVVVVKGTAYGSGEVLWIDSPPEHREWAQRAGYHVLSEEESRWPQGYEAVN